MKVLVGVAAPQLRSMRFLSSENPMFCSPNSCQFLRLATALLLLLAAGAEAKVFVARGFDGSRGEFANTAGVLGPDRGADICLEIPSGGTCASVRVGRADYVGREGSRPSGLSAASEQAAPTGNLPSDAEVPQADLAIFLTVEAQADSRIELADLELVQEGGAVGRDYHVVGRMRSLSDNRWIDVAGARLTRVSDKQWSFNLADNYSGAVDRVELQIIPETSGDHYGDDLLAIREISLNGNVVGAPEPSHHIMWALLILAAVAMSALNWGRSCIKRRDAVLCGDAGMSIGHHPPFSGGRVAWSDDARVAIERMIIRGLGQQDDRR